MNQLRRRIHSRLSALAKRRISKLGVGLTPACEQLLDRMIAIGVERLEHQRALEREEQLIICEQNLFRLIMGLHERAMELGTFPMADKNTFERMQEKMCPAWPFC